MIGGVEYVGYDGGQADVWKTVRWPDTAHYTHQEDNTDITLNMEIKWIPSN